MNKSDTKSYAQAVRGYLAELGIILSTAQSMEVVARGQGFANKEEWTSAEEHEAQAAVASNIVRVSGPLSPAELRASQGQVREVLAVPLTLLGDANIEALNDSVAQQLTGSECGLLDIGYRHLPSVHVAEGFVAFEVRGQVNFEAIDD